MTKEQLAEQLNGNEYGEEMTAEQERLAKKHDLLIVFGASDDLVELRGAINDGIDACDSIDFFIDTKAKTIIADIDVYDEDVLRRYDALEYVKDRIAKALKFTAIWDADGYSWVYELDFPHAEFDILEDGDKYCRGIVIDLKECGHAANG